ncbi:Transposon Tf2-12 polyprotein [Trametes pubescens]|uniref:Transposon Tf2-12 polyprotein n=1 Tax=Trametes pubescens TaxID=154538 RepID=A0A1M2W5P7_TRAPU|nr:Transposon Tf2-12 polyprotein [Trametes pubescens]
MDIAIEQNQAKEKRTFEDIVPEPYRDFVDVFSEDTFNVLPEHRPYDHVIELLPGARPYCGKIYPMTLEEQDALDVFLEENLRTGRIRPSKSPWGAPFFFVKKKDGKLRPVQDYRKLNDMTKKNKYPLPLMSELFDRLKGAKYFTKLDIRWGYNNIRMKDGDEEKAAFITNRGSYDPLVMFFGLSNSPSTFQMMMNDIFRDLILKGKVIVYLNDILIFTESLDEHRSVVRQVLQILRENKLTVKPEKCEFEVQETEYLGHIIAPGIVKMDPAKVAGVTSWPTPKCKRDVQGFLGFANFYRRFIKDFSKIAAPLNRLTGLAEWQWSEVEQDAFERIKTAITSAPVLAVPNDHDPFKVECDASKFALGAELAQKQDGQWRTIAFLSKSLSPAERNYEIYDREMLALMTALDEWRHFLKGSQQKFEIHTDHKNLEYFRKPQRLNPRQARWVVTLQDFDFALTHRPGRTMGKSDALSRRPDHDIGDSANDDVTLLKPEWFRPIAIDGEDNIRKDCFSLRERLEESVVIELGRNGDFEKTEDGLVYRKGKLVVPNDKGLRGRIITAHHDSVSAGHPGREKTQELIFRSYWWPSMRKDISAYVKGCAVCQKSKIDHRRRAAPLNPNPIAEYNWEYISVDMITHLPDSHGNNAILVIVDMKSKDFIAVPCTDQLSSEGWANLFIKHVYANHGLPQRVYSDRGSIFVSAFIRDLYRKLGVQGNPSTAYHPQTDGQTERINQEIENYLRIFVNHRQDDWSDWLPLAMFAYRNRKHSATGFSPFYMTHGREAFTGVETKKTVAAEEAEQFAARMKRISEQAAAALKVAKDTMKRKYDKHRRESIPYNIGDWVLLDSFHISSDRPNKKLEDKRYGPFQIQEKVGRGAYRLKLPKQWKAIHPVFNEVLL